MRFYVSIVLIIFQLFSVLIFGQNNDSEINRLKMKIENLYKNQEIDSINEILNQTFFLESEYELGVLNRNLESSIRLKNDDVSAKTYLILGNFWHKQANKLKAFEYYLQSEALARKTKNEALLATCLMNKSTLINHKTERIKNLTEASEIFKKKKDSINLIKSYLNTGIAYSQLHEESKESVDSEYNNATIQEFKKKGFEYYKKAEKLNQNLKNKELEGALYIYYGEWYNYEKDFSKAENSFLIAKKTLEQTKNIKAQVYCIFMLAKTRAAQGKYNEASPLLQESEKLAIKNRFNDYLAKIYFEYVNIYTKQGDYKKALEYSQLYSEKSIELVEQSGNDKMRILSLEKNIVENQLQLGQYESKSKLNRFFILLSLLIACFVGVLSYLTVKNKKRKIDNIEKNNIITEIKLKNQQLEDELLKEKIKFNQEHLISFANQVNKIEIFLDEMKDKFRKIPGSSEEINQFKMSFSELLNGQRHLKQINSLSSELNQDFFFYIKQNYPSISKGEEQLLAYIILNIRPKEISRILNISEKSIYIKRYRLRKKLKLKNEETFEDFYKKIISAL